MKSTMTAFDKTATIQKCVTLDLIRTINEVLLSPVIVSSDVPHQDDVTQYMTTAQQRVLDSLGALIAAKAYLWMVAHPKEYLRLIETKAGSVTLTNPDLTYAGYSLELTVDNTNIHIKVNGRDGALLFNGKCDLSHSL